MCCFSRAVPFVGGTKIFARDDGEDRQLLAYSMDLEIGDELAMVLPLPVPPAAPDGAVRFIDLSGYPAFFKDLAAAFPPAMMPAQRSRAFGPAPHAGGRLVVHEVGDFEASFVPRVGISRDSTSASASLPCSLTRVPSTATTGLPCFA